jgi:TPR repeat protein
MKKWLSVFALVAFFISARASAGELEVAAAAFEKKDYQISLVIWEDWAERGDPVALYHLGYMYVSGSGVPKDLKRGIDLMTDSALKENIKAMTFLASAYGDNAIEAYPLWRKAAEKGDAVSQFNVGTYLNYGIDGVQQNKAEAAIWYRKAADQDITSSQYRLGELYQSGSGVELDYTEAMKWYRKAADKGNPDAQDQLAFMYWEGQGVSQDYIESAKWQRKAADQGRALSQAKLGVMYELGMGVPVDNVQAHKWVNLAIGGLKGDDALQRARVLGQLATIAKKLTPAQIAEAQKLAREWKPKLTPRSELK